MGMGKTDYLLSLIREGKRMTLGQQLCLTAYLSVPAIMAQVSSIVMQYIDASMVGRLGANAAASIGLVSTTTWLFWGLCAAVATGFSVQVAHKIGAGDFIGARKILRQSIAATLVFGLLIGALGAAISGMLPGWLGGDKAIRSDSFAYFLIFSLFLPALQLNFLAGGMLRCSGQHAHPQYAEHTDVHIGCGIQLLSYIPFPASIFGEFQNPCSRCRIGRGRCGFGDGTGRTGDSRGDDVVSLPTFAHAEAIP